MRRVLLVLAVMSFAGWSQPAAQQAQPPIAVRIETPPESILMMLLKVVLPTILGAGLGAGITLYGLRQNRLASANAPVVDSADAEAARLAEGKKLEDWKDFHTVTDTLMNHFYLARLATADEVFAALESTTKDLLSPPDLYSLDPEALTRKIAAYIEFRNRLCDAGRKDLWGTPETEARAESITKG